MYILADKGVYIGKDKNNRPVLVTDVDRATAFKTEFAASNYANNIPDMLKKYNWCVCSLDEMPSAGGMIIEYPVKTTMDYGRGAGSKLTDDENFDICAFFENTVRVMSQIDGYISDMVSKEQITDMKILDVRHYIRNNDHKLNAIQMQRLGYYLQELEKERYDYKAKRIIASMFANDIDALKDKRNIDRMNDVLTSKYRPKVLDDTDIEYIINKKKDMALIG